MLGSHAPLTHVSPPPLALLVHGWAHTRLSYERIMRGTRSCGPAGHTHMPAMQAGVRGHWKNTVIFFFYRTGSHAHSMGRVLRSFGAGATIIRQLTVIQVTL